MFDIFGFSFVRECVASLKNIGEKTANLFDRKKKEASDLAAERAAEAQTYAVEQARKASEAADQTKKEAAELLDGAGELKLNPFFLTIWNLISDLFL